MIEKFALALDVGGLSLKSALVSSFGSILPNSIQTAPINSKGSYNEIMTSFIDLFSKQFERAEKQNIEIIGIGIGMPGPFDYKNGISLIKDVDKYESIYKVNLKEEFLSRLKLNSAFQILFENDAWSFLRGEAWQGAGKGFSRIIGLTLGTGLGSGFIVDDEIIESGPGIPDLAWIGGLMYNNSVVDNRVSTRGIIGRYLEISDHKNNDLTVKDIAERAIKGDKYALDVFNETGAILGKILLTVIKEFETHCFVIGGQVAKSYQLFGPAVEKEFAHAKVDIPIKQAECIEQSALLGAARFLFKHLD